ncbi:cellulase family glycosylhydrolase, partial [bacterium]|nr:cellulase family glycosylhydrolase [bacterium]
YTRIFTGSYVENPKSFGIEKNNLAPAENRLIVPWARSSVPGYINGGNKFDLDKWDSEYFKRLKDFISEAGKRGIIVEVTLFSSTYQDGYWMFSPLHPSNNINNIDKTVRKKIQTLDNGNMLQYQEKMVRKIVQELKEFDNIFYEIQNEPWSDQTVTAHILNQYDEESNKLWKRVVDLASDASLEWQETIVSYIKDEESGLQHKHLIAQNYCNFLYPLENVLPDISIINFHYAWPDAASLNYGWDRVLNLDETGFAGKEDMTYRKQAWNFIISGGGAYNHLDYSFAVGYEDGTYEHKTSPGGGSVNLRSQLKVLKDFMYSFDFIRMKPDNMAIKKAPGVFARALTEAGKQYAIYIDGGEGCEIELGLPEGVYKADWINTKNGDIKKTEMFSHSGGYIILSSPQYNDDIALRVLSNKLF